jgi:hypothetical protein
MTGVEGRHLQQGDYPKQILKPETCSLMPGPGKPPDLARTALQQCSHELIPHSQ